MNEAMLDAALRYADNGWRVFPLIANGKTPATEHGFKDATTDATQIREWFANGHGRNLGIRTGNGLLVIDIDVKNGVDGFASLAALNLGDTRTVRTPSGGQHRYYTVRAELPNSAGTLAPGVDTRADGGYVVAPPSAIDGAPYSWEDDLPTQALPDAMVQRLLEPRRSGDFHELDGQPVPIGQQDVTLNQRACSYRYHGLSRAGAVAALWTDVQTWPQDPQRQPWTVADVEAKVDRAWRDIEPGTEEAETAALLALVTHGERLSSHPSLSSQLLSTWPELDAHAYHGLAGDVVRSISPHTEADPVAVLIHLLVGFGSLIGRGAYSVMESDWHYGNLYAVAVGETSKGRKGTSWNRVRWPLAQVDPEWAADRIMGGLSSGEGLIKAVCDDVEKFSAKGESSVIPGVKDKRLLVFEAEFSSVLKQCTRESNILDSVIREAWDTGHLRNMTVDGRKATDAHVSIIGHVTKAELLRQVTETDAANGFGNRFLWYCVRRAQMLPRGGGDANLVRWVAPLRDAVARARRVGEIGVSAAAWELWDPLYPKLSTPPPGLLGSMIGRAEAQVRRIAMLYALLDGVRIVDVAHLEAALAVWQYCADSARYIFGERLGDPTADAILGALRRSASGLTRKQISVEVLGRHQSSAEIERALGVLLTQQLALQEFVDTGGRRAEVWRASKNHD